MKKINNIISKPRVEGKPTLIGLHILRGGETRELKFTDFTKFDLGVHPQIQSKIITLEEALKSYKEKDIHAKVDTGQEAFWTIIKGEIKEQIFLEVNNELIHCAEHKLHNGDSILVHRECIAHFADFN